MADQSASAFSLRCINRSDVKLTLGTGGFMSNTVGSRVFSHKNGNYYDVFSTRNTKIECISYFL